MAETVTNRCKYRALEALRVALGANQGLVVILGTQTGVNDPDLNTLADLDAVTGVSFHTERIALTGGATTEDDTNNRGALDYGNATFAAAPGVTAQGVAWYDNTNATDATRDLLTIHTTGFPQPMDGGLVVNIADVLRGA